MLLEVAHVAQVVLDLAHGGLPRAGAVPVDRARGGTERDEAAAIGAGGRDQSPRSTSRSPRRSHRPPRTPRRGAASPRRRPCPPRVARQVPVLVVEPPDPPVARAAGVNAEGLAEGQPQRRKPLGRGLRRPVRVRERRARQTAGTIRVEEAPGVTRLSGSSTTSAFIAQMCPQGCAAAARLTAAP